MDAVEVLRRSPLGQGFTDTGLQILGGICAPRVYPDGSPLFAENMVGESMFIIEAGRVQISCRGPGNAEADLGVLGPGDVLGELCLVTESRRMCTATAVGDVTVWEMKTADFQSMMAVKPQACLKFVLRITRMLGVKLSNARELMRVGASVAK